MRRIFSTIILITSLALIGLFSVSAPDTASLVVYLIVFLMIGLLSFSIAYLSLSLFLHRSSHSKLLLMSIVFGVTVMVGLVMIWAHAMNLAAAMLISLIVLLITWYVQQRTKSL